MHPVHRFPILLWLIVLLAAPAKCFGSVVGPTSGFLGGIATYTFTQESWGLPPYDSALFSFTPGDPFTYPQVGPLILSDTYDPDKAIPGQPYIWTVVVRWTLISFGQCGQIVPEQLYFSGHLALTITFPVLGCDASVPMAMIKDPGYLTVNSPGTFDGTSSYSTDGGTLVAFTWAFTRQDGGMDIRTGPVVKYSWPQVGMWPVTLTVTDSGGYAASATTAAVVTPGPHVSILSAELIGESPPEPSVNGAVTLPFFCGNGRQGPTGDVIHLAVDKSDGPYAFTWTATSSDGEVIRLPGQTDPEFRVAATAAGSTYEKARRDAVTLQVHAFLKDSAGKVVASDSLTVGQSEVGRLRQEYADHRLQVPISVTAGPLPPQWKPVPDVRYFRDRTKDAEAYEYSKGDPNRHGDWPQGSAGSNWALIDPWMVQMDGEVRPDRRLPRLTSAYRTPVYYGNISPHPLTWSEHLWGGALDYATAGSHTVGDYISLAEKIASYSSPSGQVLWEGRTDHVHVQEVYVGAGFEQAGAWLLVLDLTAGAAGANTTTVNAGTTITGYVILRRAELAEVQVSLEAKPNKVDIPESVTVPANHLAAAFTVTVPQSIRTKQVVITAVAATAKNRKAKGTLTVRR